MDPFWSLAKRTLRYRKDLVLAAVFALVSAGGLGAGILGIQPVLDIVLADDGSRGGLPELATAFNERVPEWAAWATIAEDSIAALPPGPFTAVLVVVLALAVLSVIGATANVLHQWLALGVVHRVVADVRREVFARVIDLPLRDVVREGPADLVSRIMTDTQTLAGGLSALLGKAAAQATKGAAAFGAALVIDWRLTLAATVVAPLMVIVIRKLGKRIRRASRRALESQADLYRTANETIQGLRVVKVHAAERTQRGRFGLINKRVLREQLRVRRFRALASPLIELLTIFVLGAMVLVAVKLILDGHLSKQGFVLTLAALGVAGASLKPLTGFINEIQISSAAAGRLRVLLDASPESGHGADARPIGPMTRELRFDDVSLTYPGQNTPAVDGVSLTVDRGQTVAFVGRNGSGKTSLLSLVPRLFDPDAGRVLIDGTDLRGVSLRRLRRQVAVVTQETVLFRGTIAENIAWGATDASRERIEDAARRARADRFIEQLPEGYDAPVGEQGATLSGGQRQRLAIARAVLRDPSVLVLDEATSMIDAESESEIAEAIAEFSRGRTCLVVAHRLSTVVNADRIVVLEQGRIADTGTHSELLDRCEIYQHLARHQLVSA